MIEDFSLAIRELLHRITEREDVTALSELVKLVLDLWRKGDQMRLGVLMQLLHDEKTYILSDTEILPGKELELMRKAALYHVVYELVRALRQNVECRIPNAEKLRESIADGNLSDLTTELVHGLRCIAEKRHVDDVCNVVKSVLSGIQPGTVSKPPEMKDHVMKYILENFLALVDLLRKVE